MISVQSPEMRAQRGSSPRMEPSQNGLGTSEALQARDTGGGQEKAGISGFECALPSSRPWCPGQFSQPGTLKKKSTPISRDVQEVSLGFQWVQAGASEKRHPRAALCWGCCPTLFPVGSDGSGSLQMCPKLTHC